MPPAKAKPVTPDQFGAEPQRSHCPDCFKSEPEDRDNCPRKDLGMCPPPIPFDGGTVEIVCAAPCGGEFGKHLAIPIGNVMKRNKLTNLGRCGFDVCRARVVHPKAKPPTAAPPPISELAKSQQTGKPAAAGDGKGE